MTKLCVPEWCLITAICSLLARLAPGRVLSPHPGAMVAGRVEENGPAVPLVVGSAPQPIEPYLPLPLSKARLGAKFFKKTAVRSGGAPWTRRASDTTFPSFCL